MVPRLTAVVPLLYATSALASQLTSNFPFGTAQPINVSNFPVDFAWGVGTSAFQIEGAIGAEERTWPVHLGWRCKRVAHGV